MQAQTRSVDRVGSGKEADEDTLPVAAAGELVVRCDPAQIIAAGAEALARLLGRDDALSCTNLLPISLDASAPGIVRLRGHRHTGAIGGATPVEPLIFWIDGRTVSVTGRVARLQPALPEGSGFRIEVVAIDVGRARSGRPVDGSGDGPDDRPGAGAAPITERMRIEDTADQAATSPVAVDDQDALRAIAAQIRARQGTGLVNERARSSEDAQPASPLEPPEGADLATFLAGRSEPLAVVERGHLTHRNSAWLAALGPERDLGRLLPDVERDLMQPLLACPTKIAIRRTAVAGTTTGAHQSRRRFAVRLLERDAHHRIIIALLPEHLSVAT